MVLLTRLKEVHMERKAIKFLQNWLVASERLPLVLRGARQVGKTWLVRDLAKSSGRELIELNFEKRPQLAKLFSSNEPSEILERLEASVGKSILPGKSLLFLDEIQAAPDLFSKLRWFAEDMSELPVIAAGSLLEFVLHDHQFSMPVGRISYMHLEPLSFEEFLLAHDKPHLHRFIENYTLDREIPEVIHEQLIALVKEYVLVGGMPTATERWLKTRSWAKLNQIHQDLLATYRDDFGKYGSRLPRERLTEVMNAVPRQLGQKFVFSRANAEAHPDSVKRALTLLGRARVCHAVISTAANGTPLAAESKDKFFTRNVTRV
jgi:predicted AAA+ superfamily ATPase